MNLKTKDELGKTEYTPAEGAGGIGNRTTPIPDNIPPPRLGVALRRECL